MGSLHVLQVYCYAPAEHFHEDRMSTVDDIQNISSGPIAL